ncbi:hypothetical protein MSL71_38260 [Desulfoluna butyratoxydans]|uniref:Uncharacterized protein n=1 Tax=Desulfoluna butyratoxydans TaxID=231438 RepID=A0A4U8YXH8_9BACT|nr:hypothetical protein MSL71_38260 [Desulfoluna butyratoxydans]
MKFCLSQKISLCISALIVFALVLGFAGFLLVSPPQHDTTKETETVQASPKQPEKNSHLPAQAEPLVEKTHAQVPPPLPPEPTLLQDLSEEFTSYALKTTDAEKIRVETSQTDGRGYVAFMARQEGFERGIPTVMQELAQVYLDTFTDAPAITLSLVIGGGIKGQMTFLRDEDGAAVLPERYGAQAME